MGYKISTVGKFQAISQCQNPAWTMLRFSIPEIYKGTELTPEKPNCTCLVPSDELMKKYQGLAPGKQYHLSLHAELEPPKGNYSARINFNILGLKEAAHGGS